MKWNKQFEYPASMRSSIEGKRHYEITGKKLPSVTTILSATESESKKDSLEQWRNLVGHDTARKITEEAAARGTAMHSILEHYVLGTNKLDITRKDYLDDRIAERLAPNDPQAMDDNNFLNSLITDELEQESIEGTLTEELINEIKEKFPESTDKDILDELMKYKASE